MTTRRRARCPYCGAPGNGEPCDPSCPPRQPPQTPAPLASEAWVCSTASPQGPATPGEVAYAAYMAVLALSFPVDFAALPGTYRHAWDAAAQAVLAMQKEEETPRA
jgi:hypothetical protein